MRKTMDDKTFNCVKIMLMAKAPYAEIEKYLGVSKATIGRISGCESFEEYRQMMTAAAIAYKQKKEQEKAQEKLQEQPEEKPEEQPEAKPEQPEKVVRYNVTIQATHYMEEQQKRTNELLTLISNKLAFIVEELTGKGQ